jgi:hypothetical protein
MCPGRTQPKDGGESGILTEVQGCPAKSISFIIFNWLLQDKVQIGPSKSCQIQTFLWYGSWSWSGHIPTKLYPPSA